MALVALVLAIGCGGDDRANPSGTFEATEVDISPKVAGQLLAVGADEGDQVAVGDTLLVTDTELLRLKRVEAAASLEGVAARREAAMAEVAQVQRSLDLAKLTLQRLDTMQKHGNTSAQQVDDATAQVDILGRKLSAARQNVSALDSEAERLRASLAVFDRQLADGVLLSPLDGTVLLRTAEPGEMAAPGAVALRLADLRRLELRFYLDETDLGAVKLGQKLPVHVDAFPGRDFEGEVTWISSEAEFTPKNAQTHDARAQLVYAVKLEVANPQGELAIGMPAEVEVGD
jgi:HlyD family secretion protein